MFIDADVLVLKPILYDSFHSIDPNEKFVATATSSHTFNSGFFWFRPSKETFDHLMAILNSNSTDWHQGQTKETDLTEQNLLIHYFVRGKFWSPMAGCLHVTLPHLTEEPTEVFCILPAPLNPRCSVSLCCILWVHPSLSK